MKVVCLGNEFIQGDSLAVQVGERLKGEGFEVLHVKDSFQLMGILSEEEDFVILDVVKGLKEVCLIKVEDLEVGGIRSAHDFDASYVLRLMGEDVRIVGLPMEGDLERVFDKVLKIIPM
jgi:Ni,Fe-hydrogenase maturation factor